MEKTLLILIICFFAFSCCQQEIEIEGEEVVVQVSNKNECHPRQVRLLIGEDYANYNLTEIKNTATIIFQTYVECLESSISVTLSGSQTTVYSGESYSELIHSKWDGEQFCHHKTCTNLYYDQYAHVFRLPLPFDTPFTYTVSGKPNSKSNLKGPFSSHLPSLSPLSNEKLAEKPQRILFFGDQDTTPDGQLNMKRWRELKKKGKKHAEEKIDMMMFLGDYAYEFFLFNGKRGDNYLEALEEFAAEWPIAMQAGNHEDNYNFKFYNEKFRMPSYNETKNNYYSFNQGYAHFIGLNLHYFDSWATSEQKQDMLNWVEQDLIRANQNRNQTPWIIIFGHKPIYCSVDSECKKSPQTFAAFDSLFYKYSVDLYLGAHVHSYQFLKPLFANSIQSYEGDGNHIINPQGMVSIIQGNGGHILEFLENVKQDIAFLGKADERAIEIKNYVGYGILEIYNSTTICLQNVQALWNRVESTHCITSNHQFNPEQMNTVKANDNIVLHEISFYIIITLFSLSALLGMYFAFKFLLSLTKSS